MADDKRKLLKRYFGHDAFRPGQEELIDALLSGRDALGVMPTGAGKSVCYQLPAMLLPGVTLVISPLISLMKDQVAALIQMGIPAAYLNSSLTAAQQREALRRAEAGAYKIIYTTPERLATGSFLQFAQAASISLIAVDEAHCVSQWGQDFRPSYLNVAGFVNSLQSRPVIGAFTATATEDVKADMVQLLHLIDPISITTGFDRPNLYFEVAAPKSKDAYLRAFLAERQGLSGIVYCATRKAVEAVCEKLTKAGVSATRYHAGLPAEERQKNQDDFVYDRARVMVATNAFGMGIDKSNVSFVVHYNMPKDVESYYQEAGRAGRDGMRASCVLLYSAGDVKTARFLIENGESNGALTKEERTALARRDLMRLSKMVGYCKTTGCLRGYLLGYFGEAAAAKCNNCGNCATEFVNQDITAEAKKILSGVARVEKKYPYGLGVTMIVRMLHGSREQRVIALGLNELSTYGIMSGTDRTKIRAYLDLLIQEGFLALSGGEYPVVRLADKAEGVLFEGQTVTVTQRRQTVQAGKPRLGNKAPAMPAQLDDELFQTLKALRLQFARQGSVPAYMVFSNAALMDMAMRRPTTTAEFLQVAGVGEAKAKKYGDSFISEIRSWLAKKAAEAARRTELSK